MIAKEAAENLRVNKIKNKPKINKAKKQYSVYLNNFKKKGITSTKLIKVIPMGNTDAVICLVQAKDPIYNYQHIIQATGKGPYYEYVIN